MTKKETEYGEDECLRCLKGSDKVYLFSDEEEGLLFGVGDRDLGFVEFYENGTYKLYPGHANVATPESTDKELLMLILMKKEEIEILNKCRAKKGFNLIERGDL